MTGAQAKIFQTLPNSGWISRYLCQPEDIETAIAPLRRSYKIALKQPSKRGLPTARREGQKEPL